MSGLIAVALFIVWMILLNRLLRRWERWGWWDKEGHGSPEHPDPGVDYRWLEVPPKRPFD
jgi:hypothetical protein